MVMTIILTVAYIDTSLFRLKFLSGAYDNLKNRRALRFLPKTRLSVPQLTHRLTSYGHEWPLRQ